MSRSLVLLSLLTSFSVSVAQADDLFRESDLGYYAPAGSCGDYEKVLRVSIDGIITHNMVCLNLDGSRVDGGYSLFFECGGPKGNITYMGTWQYEAPIGATVNLSEYRGASGAPDLNFSLERCQ